MHILFALLFCVQQQRQIFVKNRAISMFFGHVPNFLAKAHSVFHLILFLFIFFFPLQYVKLSYQFVIIVIIKNGCLGL